MGAVAMENAAQRVQLAAFQRMRKRPVLTTFDRLFWVGLSRVWRGWRGPLLYVKPDTVIRRCAQILRLCNLWIVPGDFRCFRDARPNGTEMDRLNCCLCHAATSDYSPSFC